MRMRWPFERFDGTVCKASLKMAISRARMCTNRLQNSIRLQRRDISVFLKEGREEGARLKGEHLLRECRLERAMEILVTVCELLISRMNYLATEKTCPPDLLSPIHSLLYCEPRLSIEELAAVRRQFAVKFGDAFVDAALKNAKQEVHFKLVHALSLASPLEVDLQHLLSGIAQEYLITDWKPSISIETSGECHFIPRPSTTSGGLEVPSACNVALPEQLHEDAELAIGEKSNKGQKGMTQSVDGCLCNCPLRAACTATTKTLREYPSWQPAHVLQHYEKADNQPCFPSLEPPPQPHSAFPGTSFPKTAPVRATRERDLHSSNESAKLKLQYTNPWQYEDCATPFHQEIPLGAWPSPGDAASPPPTRDEAHYCQQGSNYESAWEVGALYSTDATISRSSLTDGCGAEALQQSHSCGVPIPAAAMPAFFPA